MFKGGPARISVRPSGRVLDSANAGGLCVEAYHECIVNGPRYTVEQAMRAAVGLAA